MQQLQEFPEFKKIYFYHWVVTPRLRSKLSGLDQNLRMIGAAGVDLVVGQIHRRERGIPTVQKCVMIEPSHREAKSPETRFG